MFLQLQPFHQQDMGKEMWMTPFIQFYKYFYAIYYIVILKINLFHFFYYRGFFY